MAKSEKSWCLSTFIILGKSMKSNKPRILAEQNSAVEPSSHTCHACALAQFNLASGAFRAQICSTCVSDAHREFRTPQVSASPLKDWQDKLGGGGRMSAPQEGLLWIHSPCLPPPSSPAVGGMSSISHPTLKRAAFVEASLWSCDSH